MTEIVNGNVIENAITTIEIIIEMTTKGIVTNGGEVGLDLQVMTITGVATIVTARTEIETEIVIEEGVPDRNPATDGAIQKKKLHKRRLQEQKTIKGSSHAHN